MKEARNGCLVVCLKIHNSVDDYCRSGLNHRNYGSSSRIWCLLGFGLTAKSDGWFTIKQILDSSSGLGQCCTDMLCNIVNFFSRVMGGLRCLSIYVDIPIWA